MRRSRLIALADAVAHDANPQAALVGYEVQYLLEANRTNAQIRRAMVDIIITASEFIRAANAKEA